MTESYINSLFRGAVKCCLKNFLSVPVMPAQVGIHKLASKWMPAKAGMTPKENR